MGMDERALGKTGTDRYSMDAGTCRAKGANLDLNAKPLALIHDRLG